MSEYRWLNEESQLFLDRGYLLEGQTVDQRVDVICNTAEKILKKPGYAKRLKENFKKGWYSFSTPIWSNFGTDRGFGCSCYGSYLSDEMSSIAYTWAEIAMMSKYGGGTSAYFGDIRPRGSAIRNNGTSSGAVHFMQAFDNLTNVISQGSTRRGHCAVYLPIDHDDIEEFLTIRSEGSPIQDLSYGVCVSDYWMQEMIDGDQYKRKVWAKVLESRNNVGYPYIFFTDNVNNNTVDCYKDNPLYKISHANMCAETSIPDNSEESFVCNLSSMNVLYYDEWKDTDAVEVLVYLLDAVVTEFIEKASKIRFMDRAVRFATNHRALGIGWLGWHSYLQSKMIPWESMDAKNHNGVIAKNIQESAHKASEKLAIEYGPAPVCKEAGINRRNTTLTAIAPTKSSSFIIGQASEGIEPHRTNYYIKDLQKIKKTIKNKHLESLLEEKGMNNDKVWDQIMKDFGSVRSLDFLNDHEKSVFKTFREISQMEVIIQAAQRQQYVDQSQSLNLMIHPSTPTKEINGLIIEAWKMGIKTLYYQFSVNAAQEFSRNLLNCSSCEA